MRAETRKHNASPAQLTALVIGLVYLALGVAGFFTGASVLWFSSGPLLDLVRTAIGLAALVAARHAPSAEFLGAALMVVLAGLTAYGMLAGALGGPREFEGVFSPRWADTILHGVTMLVAAVMGLYHRRRPAAVQSRERFVAHRAP